jgi:hypothetical protein
MLRRSTVYLLLLLMLGLAAAAPALASTYFVYDQYGGTWHDANKTASPYDNRMCWAAAASNILDWGRWDAGGNTTETSIFKYFVDHWTDKAGYMAWGWNWWFSGAKPPITFYAYPDVAGGAFFRTLKLSSYYAYASTGNLMSTIDALMHKGDGITITIRKGSAAHAVTVWGFNKNNAGVYDSIYITDSDDGYTGLRNYALIYQSSAWYLGGGYSGWRISDIQALGLYASTLGRTGLPAAGIDDTNQVPIAPSWVLFGTGAAAFFFRRRRGSGRT